ncbi:MAG: flavoprotein, partial [Chitinophagaceae bacterium]|nr:flavoprotein [Chitinophagaceae bacterium]
MTRPLQILAISGSTRAQSTNQVLIDIIAGMLDGAARIVRFDGLSELPHFNPDLDTESPPEAVVAYRRQLKEA